MASVGAGASATPANTGARAEPPPPGPTASAVAGAPEEQTALDKRTVEVVIRRGEEALARGDLASARLLLDKAAGVDGRAAWLLARTYDPNTFRTMRVIGPRPDPAKAIAWYEKAVELGYVAAGTALDRLRPPPPPAPPAAPVPGRTIVTAAALAPAAGTPAPLRDAAGERRSAVDSGPSAREDGPPDAAVVRTLKTPILNLGNRLTRTSVEAILKAAGLSYEFVPREMVPKELALLDHAWTTSDGIFGAVTQITMDGDGVSPEELSFAAMLRLNAGCEGDADVGARSVELSGPIGVRWGWSSCTGAKGRSRVSYVFLFSRSVMTAFVAVAPGGARETAVAANERLLGAVREMTAAVN